MKKPTIAQIVAYCKERGNNIDAWGFHDFYQSKGWLVGKSPMKDWQACVRTWERNSTHSMSIKQREEAYKREKQVYMKPLPKPKPNPRILELNKEMFALQGNIRTMNPGQKIAARKKIREMGREIQLIKDNDSKIGRVLPENEITPIAALRQK
jgi:hypothetical protein